MTDLRVYALGRGKFVSFDGVGGLIFVKLAYFAGTMWEVCDYGAPRGLVGWYFCENPLRTKIAGMFHQLVP